MANNQLDSQPPTFVAKLLNCGHVEAVDGSDWPLGSAEVEGTLIALLPYAGNRDIWLEYGHQLIIDCCCKFITFYIHIIFYMHQGLPGCNNIISQTRSIIWIDQSSSSFVGRKFGKKTFPGVVVKCSKLQDQSNWLLHSENWIDCIQLKVMRTA